MNFQNRFMLSVMIFYLKFDLLPWYYSDCWSSCWVNAACSSHIIMQCGLDFYPHADKMAASFEKMVGSKLMPILVLINLWHNIG